MNITKILWMIAALMLAAATVHAAEPAQDSEVLLRQLAKRDGEVLRLIPEPEKHKILSPPAVLFHVGKPLDKSSIGGVEVEAKCNAPALVEMQGIFGAKATYVYERRALEGTGKPEIIRWQVAPADELTSFTLAVRGEKVVDILSAQPRDLGGLSITDRLSAYTMAPLQAEHAVNPVRDGVLSLRLAAPTDLQSMLQASDVRLTVTRDGKELVNQIVPLAFQNKEPAAIAVKLPEDTKGAIQVKAVVDEEPIASLDLNLDAFDKPAYEVPWRSIEGFSVMVRNGELCVYTTAGDPGVLHGPVDVPIPAEQVWLAAGNGVEWPVSELLLKSRRDSDWLAGGPVSFTVAEFNNQVHGYFSVAYATGPEALAVGYAGDSLRIAASAKNPVWMSRFRDPLTAATWRGNAFIDLNGSAMLVGLEKFPGEPAQARALSSTIDVRWADLGILPLPELDGDNTWITGYQDEENYYLLTGPSIHLYKASPSPLRDWKTEPIDIPEGWGPCQILKWGSDTWLFGLITQNGRGIVTWAPLKHHEKGWETVSDFDFHPGKLRKFTP